MSQLKWHKTGYKGIRYRLHPTRKHGKKFDVYYAIRYQEKGIRIEEGLGWASETGITLDKANKILADLKEAATKGEGATRLSEKRDLKQKKEESEKAEQERIEKESVTFGQYFKEAYFPTAQTSKKKRSWSTEESYFRTHIEPVIGAIPLQDIKPFHIERIKKALLDTGRAPRTAQYILAIIRQVFNAAKRDGLISGDSPTTGVKVPRIDNQRLRVLSTKEVQDILGALKKHSRTWHDLFLVSLHTGLRLSEITALAWADVDLNNGVLTVRNAKGGSRFAFLTDMTKAVFRERETGRPEELVFQQRGGGRIASVSRTFFQVLKSLNCNDGITDRKMKLSFHSARHSFATILYRETSDIYLVQKALGHAQPSMAMRYAKLSQDRLREGFEVVERALTVGSKGKEKSEQVMNSIK